MEINGEPSSLRLVMVIGSLSIVGTICIAWLIASYHKGDLADVPLGARILFGGVIAALLGAKIGQGFVE